ncbi:MAG: dihydroorotate dehydrogenase electron transfer subunit [Prevotella sp.]|nr:dihydroorotate dehydrogenase electron transfer subunit [Prevotella sp.]
MKKYVLDLKVTSAERIHEKYVLLKLTQDVALPEMLPGQFVEVRVDDSPTTFLRRPISINFLDREANELWLLVAIVGEGTRRLAQLSVGDTLNGVLPLGNTFSLDVPPNVTVQASSRHRILLVGGGVGVAPLLYYGKWLREHALEPVFLLGARTGNDLLLLDEFRKYGQVYVTTEDGSAGEKGFVTDHSILAQGTFEWISTCGPKPMMMAVARYARRANIRCEVSLENLMACGLGACLCCVEKTVKGNLCVCKEGPVFNIKELLWE